MREELRSYIENLFATAPQTSKVLELKEELLSNVTAKYDDLVSQGRSEEEAYKIAVGGIGDVDELIKELENDKIYNYARRESDRQKSAVLVSVAVGLYIIAIAVQIFFSVVDGLSPEIGCVLMFVIAAIATSMLVFNAMSHPKYRKADDTIVEEFKEWNHTSDQSRQVYRAICSAMWPIITAIYLLISIFTGRWDITWLIFIIGVAIQNIIKLSFEMRRK